MRFTIVPDDKLVIVDGIGYNNLDFIIAENVHAVQWYGNYGEVEYRPIFTNGVMAKPTNSIIDEYAEFQPALDAWSIANTPSESE